MAGARAERAKGPKGNAIGLNGTVNLPTCDLQAAKVAAKSGPRPSADVPQLFLAIFRSFCSATHASALDLFCPFCKCSMESSLSVTRRYQPRDQPRLSPREPPASTRKLLALSGVYRRDGRTVEHGTMSLPTSSFGHDGQWLSSRLGFT